MVYNITLLHSLIYPFDPVKNHALGTEVVIMITLCCTSQYYVAVSYGQLLHLFMMSVRNPQILGSLHSSSIGVEVVSRQVLLLVFIKRVYFGSVLIH